MVEQVTQIAQTTAEFTRDLGISNMYLIPGIGEIAAGRVTEFAGTVKDAAIIDDSKSNVKGLKRFAEPAALSTALISEVTVGNELVVAGFGVTVAEVSRNIHATGIPLADLAIQASVTGVATGLFSYMQQRAYGETTRWGLRKFPRTISAVSSIGNETIDHAQDKLESEEQLSKSAGSDALLIGTSLSFMRHKVKRPESTPQEDTVVLKRGAKAIAAFWGPVLGFATLLTSGADQVKDSPVLSFVGEATSLPTLATFLGCGYVAKEWFSLAKKGVTKLR